MHYTPSQVERFAYTHFRAGFFWLLGTTTPPPPNPLQKRPQGQAVGPGFFFLKEFFFFLRIRGFEKARSCRLLALFRHLGEDFFGIFPVSLLPSGLEALGQVAHPPRRMVRVQKQKLGICWVYCVCLFCFDGGARKVKKQPKWKGGNGNQVKIKGGEWRSCVFFFFKITYELVM